MEVRLRLHHEDDTVGEYETHTVETEGEQYVIVKFPLPEGMSPPEATSYLQSQAGVIREFLGERPFMIVPMRPGWTCEMGVLDPNLEDLKECIKILSEEDRRKFLDEMMGDWVQQVKDDVEEEGNST